MSRRRSLSSWLGLSEQRWTTAPNEEVRPAKTVWDWLQLLIVPAALVAIGYAFNASQADRDRDREDARANRAQTIADESRRDQVLQDYLASMGDLMLTQRLRGSKENSNVRDVARTLTLTVLRRLDGRRKGEVVRFLADSALIDESGGPILPLLGADLRGVVLRGASLSDAVFDGADLRGARFPGSALHLVRFEGASLQEATFSGATLSGVDFVAARLESASFRDVRMDRARSTVGTWQPVTFADACLSGSTFKGADARRARFADAEGVRVGFQRARLSTTGLERARLVEVKFDPAHRRVLPARWDSDGAPLTARERQELCSPDEAER